MNFRLRSAARCVWIHTVAVAAFAALGAPLSAQLLAEVEVLGAGTAGSAGVPRLLPLGRPAVGEPGMGVLLENGLPRAPATLLLGLGVARTALPAFGATLYPAASLARLSLGVLDAQGTSMPLHSGPAPADPALLLRLRFGAGYAAGGLFPGTGYRLTPNQGPSISPVLAVADFDGNGRLDLVAVVNQPFPGRISLLRQLGDGTLAPPIETALPGVYAADAAALDADGDGRMDLVFAHALPVPQLPAAVSLMHGLGDGRFAAPVILAAPAGGAPNGLAIADATGDGVLDLAVSGWAGAGVAVFAGFAGPPSLHALPAAAAPRSLRVADLDGDGLADLAVLLAGPVNALAMLRGLGGGAFAPAVLTPIGDEDLRALALGDLDGDGDADALVGRHTSGFPPGLPTLLVLANDGAGGFSLVASHVTGSSVASLRLADLDADGDLDAVVAHRVQQFLFDEIAVLTNDGGGSLGAPQELPAYAGTIEMADMDGDGHPDLAGVAQIALDPPAAFWAAGRGDGSFELAQAVPGFRAAPVRAGDLDGDGDLDLVGRLEQEGLPLAVSLWSEPGGFGPPAIFDPQGAISGLDGLDLGDVDLDGRLDAVVAGGSSVRVFSGDGQGGFAAPAVHALGGARVPRIADMNADGLPDLVVSRSILGLSVLLGQAGGGFGAPITTSPGLTGGLERFEVGEIDGDGRLDVVAQGSNGFHLLRGAGDGSLLPSFFVDPGSSQAQDLPLVLADLDLDGDVDLVRLDFQSRVRVWRNEAGTFVSGPTYPSGSWWLHVADVNLDGVPDLLGHEVLLGLGDGTFGTPHPGMATGAAGDFDGDGDIDAFASGWLVLNRLK